MINMHQIPDDRLIELLNAGDREAFKEIYERYAEKLAGFAASKLYSLDDARDVLHDVFTRLWAERQYLRISGNLQSYLFSAIRYRIIDKIRRNITREEYALLIANLEQRYAASDELLRVKELQGIIDASLSTLPEKTQQIFQLSRRENLSIAEIATAMNLSEQTIKNQLTIALKHLRQATGYSGVVILMAATVLR